MVKHAIIILSALAFLVGELVVQALNGAMYFLLISAELETGKTMGCFGR